MRNCKINHNSVGVTVTSESHCIIEECDIFNDSDSGNSADEEGIWVGYGGNLIVRRSTIHEANIGILVFNDGQATIEDCDIYGNGYAGIEVYGPKPILIRRCKIRDGRMVGLRVYYDAHVTLEQCDIYGNAGGNIDWGAGGRVAMYGSPNDQAS
jgi:parallel beta-helix repeat protein